MMPAMRQALGLLIIGALVLATTGLAAYASTGESFSGPGPRASVSSQSNRCTSSYAIIHGLQRDSRLGSRTFDPVASRDARLAMARMSRLRASAPTQRSAHLAVRMRATFRSIVRSALLAREHRLTEAQVRDAVDRYVGSSSAFMHHLARACKHGHGGSAARDMATVSEALFSEQQGHHGVNTFTNYHNASGLGPKIAPGAWVQVSCKVYDPYIQSVNPDGYWYRIASAPWNNAYYSPANTFMNGDPWNGPYTHNTDFNVPDCGSSPPLPPPAPAPAPVVPAKPPSGGSAGTGGGSCLQYRGSRIADSGSVAASLLGYYLGGLGGQVVIDWSYFSRNSSFVQKAKSLRVGEFVSGWAAPSDTDMYYALGHFTIARDTVDCYLVYDHYDFDWDSARKYLVFFPLWAIQIFGAREFDEHASGKL